jgi:hypothetical protein
MRFAGLLLGFLALTLLMLPALTAQEKKKDDAKADKAEKKDGDKKDAEKKDADKKDAEKKKDTEKPEKPAKKKEEKLEHGPVIQTKILSMKPDSSRDFTIEVPMPDPAQLANLAAWEAQQMFSIRQSPNPQTYAQRMQQYQLQLAQKQARGEGYSLKPVDVRAKDDCKVRILYPPVEYDDAGKLKKWTSKELAALKGKSKLPGYESSYDTLKVGQFVDVYLAKQHGGPKDKWPAKGQQKKKKTDDDEPMAPPPPPEVVMIVIKAEPMGR